MVAYERVFETVFSQETKRLFAKWSLTGGGRLREVVARRELTVTKRILPQGLTIAFTLFYHMNTVQGRIQRGWIGWLATPLKNIPHAEKDNKLEIAFNILVRTKWSALVDRQLAHLSFR